MKTSLSIAGLALAALSLGGAAGADKKPLDPNKKVCRNAVPTGSMLPKSECHTRAEWQAMADAQGEKVQSLDRRGVATPGGG